MDITVMSDKEEKLFSRRSIMFTIAYSGSTPSKETARTELCKRLNLMPDLTVITGISQKYGLKNCTASANSYSSVEALQKFERRHTLSRLSKREGKGGGKEAEAGEEKAADPKGQAGKRAGQEKAENEG